MDKLKGLPSTDILEVERDGVAYQAAVSKFENVLIPPVFTYTINSNLTVQNLRTIAINAGWDQKAEAIITLNAGKYIYTNSVSSPALTINGSWPRGVKFICNGFVIGKGGGTSAVTGQAGGSAISLGVNCTIDVRTGYIGGGGGAGAGCSKYTTYGGGGAGAGKGNAGVGGTGGNNQGGRKIPGSGGAGGAGLASDNVEYNQTRTGAGGQAGGGGSNKLYSTRQNHAGNAYKEGHGGGGGGGYGGKGGNSRYHSGQNITSGNQTCSGGNGGSNNGAGGAGAASQSNATGSGGAGGRAVQRNGKTVTWVGSTSHVYGAVS
jgi:hypothetical protein